MSERNVEIRQATIHDVPRIFRLLEYLHEETGDANLFDIEEPVLGQYIMHVVATSFCLVALVDGKLVGSIGLMGQRNYWSSRMYLQDTWWYVHESFRDTPAAAKLFLGAMEFAKTNKAPIKLMQGTGLDTDKFDKMLVKRGFSKLGSSYWKASHDV